MPRQSALLHEDATVRVERVTLGLPADHWSIDYRVPTRRWVMPEGGCTEFMTGTAHLLLDGATLLSLPTALPYRMKPGNGVRDNVVISSTGAPQAAADEAPACWCIDPLSMWRLHSLWHALAQGDPVAAARLPDPAVATLGTRLQADDVRSRAVLRARRFMAGRASLGDYASWSLHDVADAAHASPFHLSRLFRSQTGASLHGYRQRLRLAEAMRRLRLGERDLAGLAHHLGFSSQSHFGQVFAHATGVTPAQARAQLAA